MAHVSSSNNGTTYNGQNRELNFTTSRRPPRRSPLRTTFTPLPPFFTHVVLLAELNSGLAELNSGRCLQSSQFQQPHPQPIQLPRTMPPHTENRHHCNSSATPRVTTERTTSIAAIAQPQAIRP